MNNVEQRNIQIQNKNAFGVFMREKRNVVSCLQCTNPQSIKAFKHIPLSIYVCMFVCMVKNRVYEKYLLPRNTVVFTMISTNTFKIMHEFFKVI